MSDPTKDSLSVETQEAVLRMVGQAIELIARRAPKDERTAAAVMLGSAIISAAATLQKDCSRAEFLDFISKSLPRVPEILFVLEPASKDLDVV